MDRILVIQLRELGDTLLITPLIRQLKDLYPQSQIDVLCEPRNDVILRENRRITERIHLKRRANAREFLGVVARLRANRYDWVIEAQGLPKTAILARLTGAPRRVGFVRRKLLAHACFTETCSTSGPPRYAPIYNLGLLKDERVDLEDLDIDFPISDEEWSEAERFCAAHFRRPVAAMFFVSRFSYRIWPAEKFVAVGNRFIDRGFQLFIVHGPGEEEASKAIASKLKAEPIVGYPKMSLPVLKGVLENCSIFVGNDSGPKHIATAAGLPTVAPFGLNHPNYWTHPDASRHRFVSIRSEAREIPTIGRCTNAHEISEITVDEVWAHVEELLEAERLRSYGGGRPTIPIDAYRPIRVAA